MRNLTEQIVERLYRKEMAFSRNKNFEAYKDPTVRRAARIYRHLKSVEADLLEHGSPGTVRVDTPDERDEETRIRLTIEAMDCRRTAFLRPFELQLLCEKPELEELLKEAA